MSPTAERRSCRSHARSTGVRPDGAQVRRRTGWSMNPLSSKKTTGLPRRRAPFLSGANPVCATAPWPRRPPRGHAARAVDRSNPDCGAYVQCSRDDTSREISWRQPPRPDDTSKGRCDNRLFADRPRESRSVGVSVSRSNGACDRDVVSPSGLPSLLSPPPDATAWLKTPKRQRFPQPRQLPCLPGTSVLPKAGEIPVWLRFLSVSYHTIRISTTHGSLTS